MPSLPAFTQRCTGASSCGQRGRRAPTTWVCTARSTVGAAEPRQDTPAFWPPPKTRRATPLLRCASSAAGQQDQAHLVTLFYPQDCALCRTVQCSRVGNASAHRADAGKQSKSRPPGVALSCHPPLHVPVTPGVAGTLSAAPLAIWRLKLGFCSARNDRAWSLATKVEFAHRCFPRTGRHRRWAVATGAHAGNGGGVACRHSHR